MMTDTVNLGEQLRQIRDAKQAAAEAAEQARIRAAYEKSSRERQTIQNFWLEYVVYVTKQINQGVEPKPRKVPDVFVDGGYSLDTNGHRHQDVWQEMQQGALKLGLTVHLKYGHDGMGMRDWYELSVEPA